MPVIPENLTINIAPDYKGRAMQVADALRPLAAALNQYAALLGNLVKAFHEAPLPHDDSEAQVREYVADWNKRGLPVLVKVVEGCLAINARDHISGSTKWTGVEFLLGVRIQDDNLPPEQQVILGEAHDSEREGPSDATAKAK